MITKSSTPQFSVSGKGLKIAIVTSRYNSSLTDALLDHTVRTLRKLKVTNPLMIFVPGAYEIPVVIARLARTHRFDAMIALGIILQGKTSHAEHMALACAINLQSIAIETQVPVIHQILTPKNIQDARTRISIRGIEAAQAAVEMGNIFKKNWIKTRVER